MVLPRQLMDEARELETGAPFRLERSNGLIDHLVDETTALKEFESLVIISRGTDSEHRAGFEMF